MEREQEEGDDTSLKTRQELIDKLGKDFNEDFIRTFNFEKAQYHQVIPNPKINKGLISV